MIFSPAFPESFLSDFNFVRGEKLAVLSVKVGLIKRI